MSTLGSVWSAARGRRGWWSPAGPVVLRLLAGALLVIGLAAALRGVAAELYFGAGAGHLPVPVVVRIRNLNRLQVQQATSSGSQTVLPLRLLRGPGIPPGLQLYVDGVGQDNWLQLGTGPVVLRSVGSTPAEQLAAHGGTAVAGLCIAWGMLLVRRLVLSIGYGQPFHAKNAARIAGVAGLLVAGTLATCVLPYVASRLVLGRLGLGGPASPLAAQLAIPAAPLLAAAFLLVLAAAFRRGTELAKDTEGLI